MSADFLGRGLPFPLRPDPTGVLRYVEGQTNIEQSLHILLLTRLGERVMRPEFGSEAPALVFAPGSALFLRRLEESVRGAIREWEPRVDVLDVRAEVMGADETEVTISVDYRVKRTQSRHALVYPFYLTQGRVG